MQNMTISDFRDTEIDDFCILESMLFFDEIFETLFKTQKTDRFSQEN